MTGTTTLLVSYNSQKENQKGWFNPYFTSEWEISMDHGRIRKSTPNAAAVPSPLSSNKAQELITPAKHCQKQGREGWGVAQVVEQLPSKNKVASSNPKTSKKRKKGREEGRMLRKIHLDGKFDQSPLAENM
jgi:hypothetical protein